MDRHAKGKDEMNQTIMTDPCLGKTRRVVTAPILLLLTAVTNILFALTNYKSSKTTKIESITFQSYILANIAACHIFYSTLIILLAVYGMFLKRNTARCQATREAAGFFAYVGYCCAFINYIYLNFNRYIYCKFPMRYSSIVTKKRVIIAIIGSWLTAIAANSLRFLEEEVKLDDGLLAFRKSSSHLFTVLYVICMLTILCFNIHLWLIGHRSYRRELTVLASFSKLADSITFFSVVLSRHRLRATFVAFVLTVKNVVVFFPYVLVIQMHHHDCKAITCDAVLSFLGPTAIISGLLDPLICIFVIKEARRYLKGKLCRNNAAKSSSRVSDENAGISVITPRECTVDETSLTCLDFEKKVQSF